MEIGNVGVNAYTRPAVQGERPQTPPPAREREPQSAQPSATTAGNEASRPPVRNAEGQMTGQRVNTTA